MAVKNALKATLVERIRTLAVDHRYPADWIAQKLEQEGYPRSRGRWSAGLVERVAAEQGIAFYPHKEGSLARWPARPATA